MVLHWQPLPWHRLYFPWGLHILANTFWKLELAYSSRHGVIPLSPTSILPLHHWVGWRRNATEHMSNSWGSSRWEITPALHLQNGAQISLGMIGHVSVQTYVLKHEVHSIYQFTDSEPQVWDRRAVYLPTTYLHTFADFLNIGTGPRFGATHYELSLRAVLRCYQNCPLRKTPRGRCRTNNM